MKFRELKPYTKLFIKWVQSFWCNFENVLWLHSHIRHIVTLPYLSLFSKHITLWIDCKIVENWCFDFVHPLLICSSHTHTMFDVHLSFTLWTNITSFLGLVPYSSKFLWKWLYELKAYCSYLALLYKTHSPPPKPIYIFTKIVQALYICYMSPSICNNFTTNTSNSTCNVNRKYVISAEWINILKGNWNLRKWKEKILELMLPYSIKIKKRNKKSTHTW